MQFVNILNTDEHVQAQVLQLRNHRDVKRFMYSDHDICADEHQNWLRSLVGSHRQSVFVVMMESALAGVVSLNAINGAHRTADWAFYLDPDLQGKGLGSLVEFWLLDYAFSQVGLEKLNCEVLETNPAVVKMHQKFGFSIEGVRRKNILKGDIRIDVVLLGITRDEWQMQRSKMLPVVERASRR